MKGRGWVSLGIAGLVGLVAVMAVHGWWQRHEGAWQARRDADLARHDTTAAQRDSALAFAGLMLHERDSLTLVATAASARAARSARQSTQLQRRLDSLAALPVPTEPAAASALWEQRYHAAMAQIAALEVRITAHVDEIAARMASEVRLQAAVDSLLNQVARERANGARLAKRLAVAEAPCRVWIFPCLSRTTTAVVSSVGTAILMLAVSR